MNISRFVASGGRDSVDFVDATETKKEDSREVDDGARELSQLDGDCLKIAKDVLVRPGSDFGSTSAESLQELYRESSSSVEGKSYSCAVFKSIHFEGEREGENIDDLAEELAWMGIARVNGVDEEDDHRLISPPAAENRSHKRPLSDVYDSLPVSEEQGRKGLSSCQKRIRYLRESKSISLKRVEKRGQKI